MVELYLSDDFKAGKKTFFTIKYTRIEMGDNPESV